MLSSLVCHNVRSRYLSASLEFAFQCYTRTALRLFVSLCPVILPTTLSFPLKLFCWADSGKVLQPEKISNELKNRPSVSQTHAPCSVGTTKDIITRGSD